jgi:hypothetical protein
MLLLQKCASRGGLGPLTPDQLLAASCPCLCVQRSGNLARPQTDAMYRDGQRRSQRARACLRPSLRNSRIRAGRSCCCRNTGVCGSVQLFAFPVAARLYVNTRVVYLIPHSAVKHVLPQHVDDQTYCITLARSLVIWQCKCHGVTSGQCMAGQAACALLGPPGVQQEMQRQNHRTCMQRYCVGHPYQYAAQ